MGALFGIALVAAIFGLWIFITNKLSRERRRREFVERILQAPDLRTVYNMTHPPNAINQQQQTRIPLAPSSDREHRQLVPEDPVAVMINADSDLPPAYHDIDFSPPSYECIKNIYSSN